MPTFVFDRTDLAEPVIRVLAPDTDVTVQELYDAIREYEDEPAELHLEAIMQAAGKFTVNATTGEQTGVTVRLINEWRLEFEARAGPDWVQCFVSGGNLVAVNSFGNQAIKPSAFVSDEIRQSVSPTIITSLVDAVTQNVLDLLEADEEYTATTAKKFHRVTKTLLLDKDVSGGTPPASTITIDE